VPFHPSAWGWTAALGAAVLVGMAASHLWSGAGGGSAAAPTPTESAAALAPGSAVAATRAEEAPVPAPAAPEVPAAPAPASAAPASSALAVARVPAAAAPAPAAPEPVAPAPAAPAPAVAAPAPADGEAEDTLAVVVPRGAALWSMLRDLYGERFSSADRPALYRRVRELNPQVTDVNLIVAGDRLRLPVPPGGETPAGVTE
jgi:hypothetical protein